MRGRAAFGVLGTALVTAGLLTACSALPDEVNPARLFKSDDQPPPGADDEFPNLADVPDEPRPASSPAQIREVREGLIADRENARYTDAELRNRSVDEVNFAAASAPAGDTRRPISAASDPDTAVQEAEEIARAAAARAEAVRAAQEAEAAARAAEAADTEANAVAAAEAAPAPTVDAKPLEPPPPIEPAPQPEVAPEPAPKPVTAPKAAARPAIQTGAVESLDRFREKFEDAFNAEDSPSLAIAGAAPTAIGFAPLSKELGPEQRNQLQRVATAFGEGGGGMIRVVGHAPASSGGGTLAYDRALAAAAELERLGVPVEAMRVLAGAVDPSDADSPSLNRVDVLIVR